MKHNDLNINSSTNPVKTLPIGELFSLIKKNINKKQEEDKNYDFFKELSKIK